jgi:hypothetical protein
MMHSARTLERCVAYSLRYLVCHAEEATRLAVAACHDILPTVKILLWLLVLVLEAAKVKVRLILLLVRVGPVAYHVVLRKLL